MIIASHPQLQAAIDEADQVNPDNYREWLATWLDRYGPEIAVPKFTAPEHEHIDPLSEAAERMHPDRIITINVGDGKP